MEIADHVAALDRDGNLLASAAARTSLDCAIPTCPGWQMRDLLRHVSSVHRWARETVTKELQVEFDSIEDRGGPWPDDDDLVDWFREGHAALVRSLETARPDLACWTFLPAPSPLAFWARRQAHETAIHRADAELATSYVTPYPAQFAADGIDELLFGFVARPGGRLQSEKPYTIHIHATDVAGDWLIVVNPKSISVSRGGGAGECTVTGAASDLYLLLWNRRGPAGLQINGDASLLDQWATSVRVRWI